MTDLKEIQQKSAYYNSHKPHIRFVGEGNLAVCDRCNGGEAQLEDETCNERVLKAMLRRSLRFADDKYVDEAMDLLEKLK